MMRKFLRSYYKCLIFFNLTFVCRLKQWLFPPVDAASPPVSKENGLEFSEENPDGAEVGTDGEDGKRKKHRKEKIGFRDRKV